jgi:hypothetical protein
MIILSKESRKSARAHYFVTSDKQSGGKYDICRQIVSQTPV